MKGILYEELSFCGGLLPVSVDLFSFEGGDLSAQSVRSTCQDQHNAGSTFAYAVDKIYTLRRCSFNQRNRLRQPRFRIFSCIGFIDRRMWRRKPSQCRFLQLLQVLLTPDWVWRLTSWRCCFRCIQWRDGSRQGSELDVTGASNLQCRQRTPLNQVYVTP